jgi:hypothetical protein
MRALLLVLCACGGASATKPAQPAAPPHDGAQGTAQTAITPEVFCDRFLELQKAGCEVFAKMQLTREECVGELSKMLNDPVQASFMTRTGTCMVGFQDCGGVEKCLASLGPDAGDLRACKDEDPGKAVGVPKAEWDQRNGANITKYSQARSTKDLPLEVCTIRAESELLTTLACEDNSHPIADHEAAEMARVGNVGKGGRCGSIIDLYRVKCPEATYELFVDGYVCPQ